MRYIKSKYKNTEYDIIYKHKKGKKTNAECNISLTRQQLEARNKAGKKNEKKHGEHFFSLTFITTIDSVCLSNN